MSQVEVDVDAWRAMESRLRPFVARRVASAADVDDVLQEVFERYQRGLGSLRDDERLAPWLFSVARNAVMDLRRREARAPIAADTPERHEPEPEEADEPADGALHESMLACVAAFVAELPREMREAITLVELEGMTQKAAAAMLGISHTAMKSRVQRGRAALLERFGRACRIELDARQKVVACEPRRADRCGPCG